MSAILEQVKYRAEWLRYQEAQRRREEQQLEKERGKGLETHYYLFRS